MLTVKAVSNAGSLSLLLEIESIGLEKKADTYYLSIEQNTVGDRAISNALWPNIEKLLTGWIFQVTTLEVQQASYLPFDFSDEYIGCLECKWISAKEVAVRYGYTKEHFGHSVSPSKSKDFKLSAGSFHPTSASVSLKRSLLVDDIERCIKSMTTL
jgi:hypothetical protein